MKDIIIRTVVCGAIENNTYIVKHAQSKSAVVIDPAGSGTEIISALMEMGVQVELILLTHGHFDHIEGLGILRSFAGAPVAIHSADAAMLVDAGENLSRYAGGGEIAFAPAEKLLSHGDEIHAAGLTFKVISTPGHTRGGVSYLCADVVFTGDTLFRTGAGRTDFPHSNDEDLYASLERLFALPGDYAVYPGHEEFTTMEFERSNNAFAKFWRRTHR